MTIPIQATTFKPQMDPSDFVEWQCDLDGVVLEATEHIATFTLALDSAAVAVGVSISTDPGYTAAIVNSGKSVAYWLKVDPTFQTNALYDSVIKAAVTLSITTDAAPSRKRQRTFVTEIVNL